MCSCRVIGIDTEYSLLDRVLYYLKQNRIAPYDQAYSDRVSLKITVEEDRADAVVADLVSLSKGTVKIQTLETGFFPIDIEEKD